MLSCKTVALITVIVLILSTTIDSSFRIKILDKECYLNIASISSSDPSLDNINDKNVFWDCNGTGSIWHWHGTQYNSSLYTNTPNSHTTTSQQNYYLKYDNNAVEKNEIPSNQFTAFVDSIGPSSSPIIIYQHVYSNGYRIVIPSCSCGSICILQHADDFKSIYYNLDGIITTGTEAIWICNSSSYNANYSRITLVPSLTPTNYPPNILTKLPVMKNTDILRLRATYRDTYVTSTENMLNTNTTKLTTLLTKRITVTVHEGKSPLFLMIIGAVGGALFCCIICLIVVVIINWKKDKRGLDDICKQYDTTIVMVPTLPTTEIKETLSKSHGGKEYVEAEDHELTDSEFCVEDNNYEQDTVGFDVIDNEYNNPNIQNDEFIIYGDEDNQDNNNNDNGSTVINEESIDLMQLEIMNKIIMGHSEDEKDDNNPDIIDDGYTVKNISCECNTLNFAVTKEYDSNNELIIEGNNVTQCVYVCDDTVGPIEGITPQ